MGLRNLWQDAGYGLRILLKSPGFTVVAILTIAIGIGGTTSVFSVVRAVLLQPLPYRNADRLLSLANVDHARGLTGVQVSFTKLEQLREHSRTLAAVAGLFPTAVSFKSAALAEQLPAAQVTRSFFEVFGVEPALGRRFLPEEDAPGGAAVVIVSHRLWINRLGADGSVIGKAISLDGKPVTVIGILPASFHVPFQTPEPELWFPRVFENATLGPVRVRSGAGFLQAFGRSREGVSLEAVQNDLRAVDLGYRQDHPGFADSPEDLIATPLKESLVAQVRTSLLTLLVAVTCVLLIGCTNLTSLLLAKANGRRKELAIRTAVGATRGRIAAQLLTEAVVISAIGGALGVALAMASKVLLRWLPLGTLPRADEVAFSPGMLAFSAVLTLGSGLLFGLLPAVQASRSDIHDCLKESSGRGATSGRRSGRARALLVGAEVALAVLLLSGAGVLIKSFAKLLQVDPGFNPSRVLTMTIPLPPERYDVEKQRQFFRQLIPSVQSLPGVKSAAAVNALPIVGISPLVYCCPEGAACQGIGRDPLISIREVTPGYFSSLDIPLLRGRMLNDSDNAQNRRVIVINQTAAKVFFKDKDPIGQWLENSRARIPLTVVGVVKDVPYTAVSSPPYQEMYLPREQDDMLFPSMTLVVRADSSFPNLVSAIRRKVGEIDPDVPIADVSSLDEALASSMAQPRLTMEMGALFALVALLLTVIGLYGVLAYSVSQQLTEIGIRMALGATPRQVVGLVLKSGMSIVACGLLAGIAGSLVLTRLLQGLLFGTDARDPWILAATAIVTGAAGCLACYVPARRAARVSPNLALQ